MRRHLRTKVLGLVKKVQRFRKREDGSISIEAMLVLPMLFWSVLASYTFYDSYRQGSRNIKAAYAVADVVSRERNEIDSGYVDTLRELMEVMVSTRAPVSLRMSYLIYDQANDVHTVEWSCVRGTHFNNWNNGTIAQIKDSLPTMPNNGRMIVVETQNTYRPPFNIGFTIDAFDMRNFVFTHPRVLDLIVLSDPVPTGCVEPA